MLISYNNPTSAQYPKREQRHDKVDPVVFISLLQCWLHKFVEASSRFVPLSGFVSHTRAGNLVTNARKYKFAEEIQLRFPTDPS